MIVDIIDEKDHLSNAEKKLIYEVIKATIHYLEMSDKIEVDISIVDNEEIRILNKEYRNIDKPTDVLSFALTENEEFPFINQAFANEMSIHLGDIIISYQKMIEQANEYGHSFERELAFLVVHGFLHLIGYDHQTEEEEKEMFGIQNEVLKSYGLER